MIKTALKSAAAIGLLATAVAAHDIPETVAENVGLQIVALGAPVYVGNVNATVGNMWCGGAKNASFTIQANHAVSCSFTHTHGVTAVYFQLITSAPAKQKCAFVATHNFLNWGDGIHHDPDDVLPNFNCDGVELNGGQIVVRNR